MTGGGQHFATWAEIDVPFLVEPEVLPREGPILALLFVDDRNVRCDLLLVDDPVERIRRTISRIGGEIGGFNVEPLLGPLDHCFSCTDLCLPNGAGGFDVQDDAELNVNEIIVRIGEERWPSHRAGPLCAWVGGGDK